MARAQKEGASAAAAVVGGRGGAAASQLLSPAAAAAAAGLGEKLTGYKEIKDFVASLEKPR